MDLGDRGSVQAVSAAARNARKGYSPHPHPSSTQQGLTLLCRSNFNAAASFQASFQASRCVSARWGCPGAAAAGGFEPAFPGDTQPVPGGMCRAILGRCTSWFSAARLELLQAGRFPWAEPREGEGEEAESFFFLYLFLKLKFIPSFLSPESQCVESSTRLWPGERAAGFGTGDAG